MRRYTKAERAEQVRALVPTLNQSEIARALGVSFGHISRLIKQCGIPYTSKPRRTVANKISREAMLTFLVKGFTQTEIAAHCGVTQQAVSARIQALGLHDSKWPEARALRRRTKREQLKQAIRTRLEAGLSMSAVSRELDCTFSTVWKWCQRLGFTRTIVNGVITWDFGE